MKTRKRVKVLAIIGTTFLIASCSETINNIEDSLDIVSQEKSIETTSAPGDSCTFSGILTDADILGLIEMREEEKLARDVYIKLYEIHEHIVFSNISKSENAHTSAVLYLLNGYGIEDPALPNEGEFSNLLFANLYKQLTEQGATDLEAALKVGAFIEEYDIADLWKLLSETDNADVKRVYGNLLRGSAFHLRAFTNALKVQGVTYEPTIITNEEYLKLLEADADSENETETVTTFTPPANCVGTGPNS